jgi:hypothetical protein
MYPVLQQEITSGNPRAMKVMLQHTTLLNNYNIMLKIYDGYSAMALIRRYLHHEPDDRDILTQKGTLLQKTLNHAVHELPLGVLYGMDGATTDECLKLLELLEEYKSTCQKLQIDRSVDVGYYAMHFQGYQDYLFHRHLYKNYLDYIHQHNLELRTVPHYHFT